MKLSNLTAYNPITIQCHDNPDADALASGQALYHYFQETGKDVRLIYAGRCDDRHDIYVVERDIFLKLTKNYRKRSRKGIAVMKIPDGMRIFTFYFSPSMII